MEPSWASEVTDDWETPQYVWEALSAMLPLDDLLWDPFYCDGRSAVYWEDLGFEIYHEFEDIFEVDTARGQIVVTNPPFSKLESVLPKLQEFNLPTVLLLPKDVVTKKWFVDLYQFDDTLSKEAPTRIHFIREGKSGGAAGPECVFYFVNCHWMYPFKQ